MDTKLVCRDRELSSAVEKIDIAGVERAIRNHQLTISEACSEQVMSRAIELGNPQLVKLLLPLSGWKQFSLSEVIDRCQNEEIIVLLFESLQIGPCRNSIFQAMVRFGRTEEILPYLQGKNFFFLSQLAYHAGLSCNWDMISAFGPQHYSEILLGVTKVDAVAIYRKILLLENEKTPDPRLLLQFGVIENDAFHCFEMLLVMIKKDEKRAVVDAYRKSFESAVENGSNRIYLRLREEGFSISPMFDWKKSYQKALERGSIDLAIDLIKICGISREEAIPRKIVLGSQMKAALNRHFGL